MIGWWVATFAGMGASERIPLTSILDIPLHDNDDITAPIRNIEEAIRLYNKLIDG